MTEQTGLDLNYLRDLSVREQRQRAIFVWTKAAFGVDHACNLPLRGLRLLEEAAETAQACGCDLDQLHALLDYVFGRPTGDIRQEIGGVGVTLLALSSALSLSADRAELDEVNRVLAKPLSHFVARDDSKNRAGFGLLKATKTAAVIVLACLTLRPAGLRAESAKTCDAAYRLTTSNISQARDKVIGSASDSVWNALVTVHAAVMHGWNGVSCGEADLQFLDGVNALLYAKGLALTPEQAEAKRRADLQAAQQNAQQKLADALQTLDGVKR